MTTADIDRLAAFCELEEKGYDHRIFGVGSQGWAPSAVAWMDGYDAEKFTWRPDRDDNDCRMVLERFYEVATKKQKILFYEALVPLDDLYGLYAVIEAALLATPAEKCAAVLKVL